jgi:hypothetical protein
MSDPEVLILATSCPHNKIALLPTILITDGSCVLPDDQAPNLGAILRSFFLFTTPLIKVGNPDGSPF